MNDGTLTAPGVICRKGTIRKWLKKMARPAGFEPATYGLEVRCSILAELRAHKGLRRLSHFCVRICVRICGFLKSLNGPSLSFFAAMQIDLGCRSISVS